MYRVQRDAAILRIVGENEFVSIRTLMEELDISEATIRRDLKRLSTAGQLLRVRGGVQHLSHSTLKGQPGFANDQVRNGEAKRAIAKRAVKLCEPGDAVILDGGTSVHAMTEFITGLGLHVLTPSLPVVQALAQRSDATITLTGGEVFPEQQIVASPFPQPIVEGFFARLMFMSAQAIGPEGLMQSDSLLIRSELALIARAEVLVAVVDSSKFTQRASLVACPLDRLDYLITDSGVSSEHREMLESCGVRVVVVEVADLVLDQA
jgi:DeoR/GlpR family transcriptional regulator of sugar metabolism